MRVCLLRKVFHSSDLNKYKGGPKNKRREISCANPEVLAFPSGRQTFFFNPHGDLDIPTFPSGRQKGSFFVNFMLFLPNVNDIFFQKDKRRDHPN